MQGFHSKSVKFVNAFQSQYLAALRRRVDRDPAGEVVLPTGPAKAGDVDQVLRALDRKPRGAPEPAVAPTYSPDNSSALASSPAEPTGIKPNSIKANFSVDSGSRPPPLNLVGGYRFAGASTRDRRQIAAAIDSELGVGPRDPIVSIAGVKCFVVPSRRQR